MPLRFIGLPTQTVKFEFVLIDRIGVIVTLVVAVLVQPLVVTVNVYTPWLSTVELVIIGFCEVDINPFGPVQELSPPPVEVRFILDPSQIVKDEFIVIIGRELTVIEVVAELVQPFKECVTV